MFRPNRGSHSARRSANDVSRCRPGPSSRRGPAAATTHIPNWDTICRFTDRTWPRRQRQPPPPPLPPLIIPPSARHLLAPAALPSAIPVPFHKNAATTPIPHFQNNQRQNPKPCNVDATQKSPRNSFVSHFHLSSSNSLQYARTRRRFLIDETPVITPHPPPHPHLADDGDVDLV